MMDVTRAVDVGSQPGASGGASGRRVGGFHNRHVSFQSLQVGSRARHPWKSFATPRESSATSMEVVRDSARVERDIHGSRSRLRGSRTRHPWKSFATPRESIATPRESCSTPMGLDGDSAGVVLDIHGSRPRLRGSRARLRWTRRRLRGSRARHPWDSTTTPRESSSTPMGLDGDFVRVVRAGQGLGLGKPASIQGVSWKTLPSTWSPSPQRHRDTESSPCLCASAAKLPPDRRRPAG